MEKKIFFAAFYISRILVFRKGKGKKNKRKNNSIVVKKKSEV